MNKHYITNDIISCNEMLGSQTFNYFCMYAISKHTGHEVAFSTMPNRFFGVVEECFDTPFSAFPENVDYQIYNSQYCNSPVIEENILKLDPNCNYILNARFDYGYVYWKNIVPEIKNIFKIKTKFLEIANSIIKKIGKPTCCVNFRRGDYPIYMDSYMDYYKNALEQIPKDVTLLIISNDFEWVNNSSELTYLFKDREVIRANFINYIQLSLMTLSDYNICCPSCFGILGSVLAKNPNHILIHPYVKNSCLKDYFLHFQILIENVFSNFKLIKF